MDLDVDVDLDLDIILSQKEKLFINVDLLKKPIIAIFDQIKSIENEIKQLDELEKIYWFNNPKDLKELLDYLFEDEICSHKTIMIEYTAISIDIKLSKYYTRLLKKNIIYFRDMNILIFENCKLKKVDKRILEKYNLK